jgi:N-acetyl-anhydromuramyl-L-alanine amidase AmpD
MGPSLAALALLACSTPYDAEPPLAQAFDEAADQYGVPRDLMVAIAWSLTRLDDRDGMVAEDGAVGVMNLRLHGLAPSVRDASDASGHSEEAILVSTSANIDAAAALLRMWADDSEFATGEHVDRLEEWYPLVADWSAAPDPLVAEGFAAQVFGVLTSGLVAVAGDEVILIEPRTLDWVNNRQSFHGSGLIAQYIPASSSNYTADNRGPGEIDMVVVHTMEGSYSGAISWFQNSASGASAHYMIRSSDGEITQMVDEEDVAWHAGDWTTNARAIGIEHEGYVSDPGKWYTDAMYEASAALTRDIADRNGVPLDRGHIIGHYEVPGCSNPGGGGVSCHTDPGSGWDWDRYMDLVVNGTSSSTGPVSVLTDGNKSGTFEVVVTSSLYGITRTCGGPISATVSNGRLYATANCHLEYSGKSGDFPITWSAEAMATSLSGTMAVASYSDGWSGTVNSDGSTFSAFSGSKDLGGDIGKFSYDVTLMTDP